MDSSAASRKRQIIATLAVLIVITVIVAGVAVSNKKSEKSDSAATTGTAQTSAESTPAAETTTPAASNATYKDGTYTATGGYNSPGGAEEIEVSVTLKDGVVTEASADGKATSGEAKFYQGDFESAYKGQVVGKKIDTLKLSRVAGASLTSGGFNNALSQIKQQAQS